MQNKILIDLSLTDFEDVFTDDSARKFFTKIHCFEYDNNSTIQDLYYFLYIAFGINPKDRNNDEIKDRFRFIVDDNYISINNLDIKLYSFLNYINVKDEVVKMCWIIGIGGGGEITRENGIKYFLHPNESNHLYQPHIHASYGGEELKVSLNDRIVLEGKFKNKKKQKEALKTIINNKQEFLSYWNDWTNGINVFIDKNKLV